MRAYVLDDNDQPVRCDSMEEYALWWTKNKHRKIVEQTNLSGGVLVSTVFLGIDHNYGNPHDDRPILWETMVFWNHENDEWQVRYRSLVEAQRGHKAMIRIVRSRNTFAGRALISTDWDTAWKFALCLVAIEEEDEAQDS